MNGRLTARRRRHAAGPGDTGPGGTGSRLRAVVQRYWRLLALAAAAFAEDPKLSKFTGRVSDSGEGRWTIMAAIDEAVDCDVLTAALYARFRSRKEHTVAEKVCSAMRYQFGGHLEKKA